MPPRTLTDEQLAESVRSLSAKLHSSRRSELFAYVTGVSVSVVLLGIGLILLWYGPNSFLERVLGVRREYSITSMALWWGIVMTVAAVGGAMGVQVLSGKLRYARHWKHRVEELAIRLEDAETELHRREGKPPKR